MLLDAESTSVRSNVSFFERLPDGLLDDRKENSVGVGVDSCSCREGRCVDVEAEPRPVLLINNADESAWAAAVVTRLDDFVDGSLVVSASFRFLVLGGVM